MMDTLKNFKRWQIEKLTVAHMSKVKGERDNRLYCEEVCCQSNSQISILCKILARFRQWSLGKLQLYFYETISASSWSNLKAEAGQGKIDKVEVHNKDTQQGRRYVEGVKRITHKREEY